MKRFFIAPITAIFLALSATPALAGPGQVDSSFTMPALSVSGGKSIFDIEPLSNGQIIVGGDFLVNGGHDLARLNADGSVDPSFNVGSGSNDTVLKIKSLGSGRVAVAGSFSSYNGASNYNAGADVVRNLIILNADGTIDTSFHPGTGFDDTVTDIETTADGDILAAGFFNQYNGINHRGVVRLNQDGSVDSSWSGNLGLTNGGEIVRSIDQADSDKAFFYVSGAFSAYQGNSTVSNVMRIGADGSLDTSFAKVGSGLGGQAYVVAASGSKVLVGGVMSSYNGTAISRLIRLNQDGSLDNSFTVGSVIYDNGSNPPPAGDIGTITPTADDKILIGGNFNLIAGQQRKGIAEINSDGSLSSDFTNGGNGSSGAIATLGDGSVLVGGNFNSFAGQSINQAVKLFDLRYAKVNISGSGSVNGCAGPSCSFYARQGGSLAIAATADSGNLFSAFSGGGCTTSPCTLDMTSPQEVTATFTKIPDPDPNPNPDPNPDPNPEPQPTLSVTSVKSKVTKKGAYITSKVQVSGEGQISQSATSGSEKVWCKTDKSVTVAGSYALKCNLSKKGRKYLKKKSLQLTLRTSYTAKGGDMLSADNKVNVKRKR